MKNRILRENRLPGAESLTRPEDIPSMSMYLGEIVRRTDRNTKLGDRNELEGIPGVTTGRIVDIDKLDESSVKLDNYKDVDNLRPYREDLDMGDEIITRLPNERVENNVKMPNISNLPGDRIKLETYEPIDQLDTTLEKLPADIKVEKLSDVKIGNTLNNQPKELPEESLALRNYQEKVERLEKYREDLNISDDSIELSKYRDKQNYNNKVEELPEIAIELQKNQNKDVKSLETYKDGLEFQDGVKELDKTREDLNYSSNISELEDYVEGLKTNNTIKELPDSVIGIPGEIKDEDLDNTRVDIKNYKDVNHLDNYMDKLFFDDSQELDKTVIGIPQEYKEVEELLDASLGLPKEYEEVEELPDDVITSGYEEKIGERKIEYLPEDANKHKLKLELEDAIKECNTEDELFNRIMLLLSDARGLEWNLETKLSSIMSTYLSSKEISGIRLREFLDAFQNAINIGVTGGRGDIDLNDRPGVNNTNFDAGLLPRSANTIDIEDLFYRRLYGDGTEKSKGRDKTGGPKTTRQALLEMTLDALVETKFISRNLDGSVSLPGDNSLVDSLVNSALTSFANKESAGEFAKKANLNVKDYVGTYYKKGQAVINNMLSEIDTNSPINVPIDKAKAKLKSIYGGIVDDFTSIGSSAGNIVIGGNYYVKPSNLTNPPKVKDQQSKWMDSWAAKEDARRAQNSTALTSANLGNFFEDYWNWPSVRLTLEDLCPGSNGLDSNSTVENLYEMIKTSPYMTTPTKFGSMDNRRGTMTLDSNNHWEVVITPYVSDDLVKGNGGYSFLPMIEEINILNYKNHGVRTNYSKWVPITSFNLQKGRLSTKNAQLYAGEIVYPTAIELANELQFTIADDAYKSWRLYFEKCMEVAVYNSTPHDKNYYDSYSKKSLSEYENIIPTVVDKNFNCVAFYKNITFNIIIYIMTPQLGTIKKYNLLCVLKDFSEEYSGDIDSGGGDLNITFSIVGELDAVEYDDSSEWAKKIEEDLLIGINNVTTPSDEKLKEFEEAQKEREKNRVNGTGDETGDSADTGEGVSDRFGKNTRDTTNMEWLSVDGANAHSKAIGAGYQNRENSDGWYCARWVSYTLGAKGSNKNTKNGELSDGVSFNKDDADKMGPNLEKFGWYCIGTGRPPQDVQAGDLMWIKPFQGNAKNHEHGHIAYYNGEKWVSSYQQNSFKTYTDLPNTDMYNTHYSYWRWPKRIMPGGVRVEDAQYKPLQGTSTQCDRDSILIISDDELGKNTKSVTNLEIFNVDDAVICSKNETNYPVGLEYSTGDASSRVSDILISGGLSLGVSFECPIAGDWSGMLEEKGWYRLCKGYYPENESPMAGDIMTIDECADKGYELGHVAFFNGEKWVSDFQQSGYVMYSLDDEDSIFNNYSYWRWPKRVRNGVEEIDEPDIPEPEDSEEYLDTKNNILKLYKELLEKGKKYEELGELWVETNMKNDDKPQKDNIWDDTYRVRELLKGIIGSYLSEHTSLTLSEDETTKLLTDCTRDIIDNLYEDGERTLDVLKDDLIEMYRVASRGEDYAFEVEFDGKTGEEKTGLDIISINLLRDDRDRDAETVRIFLKESLIEDLSQVLPHYDNIHVYDILELSKLEQQEIIEDCTKLILADIGYEEEQDNDESFDTPYLKAYQHIHSQISEMMSKTDDEIKEGLKQTIYDLDENGNPIGEGHTQTVFEDEYSDTEVVILYIDNLITAYNSNYCKDEPENKITKSESQKIVDEELEYCLERLGYREEREEIIAVSDYEKAYNKVHAEFFNDKFDTLNFARDDEEADTKLIEDTVKPMIKEADPLLSSEDSENLLSEILDEAIKLLLYEEEKDPETGNRPIYDKCLGVVEEAFSDYYTSLTEEQISQEFNLDDKAETISIINGKVNNFIEEFESDEENENEKKLVEFEKKSIREKIVEIYIFQLFPDNTYDLSTVFGRAYKDIHTDYLALLDDDYALKNIVGITRGETSNIEDATEKLTQWVVNRIELFNSGLASSEQLKNNNQAEMINKEVNFGLIYLGFKESDGSIDNQLEPIYEETDGPSMKVYKYANYLLKENNNKRVRDFKSTFTAENEAMRGTMITDFVTNIVDISEESVLEGKLLTPDEKDGVCSDIRTSVIMLLEKV